MYRGSHWLCEGETFQDGDDSEAFWRNASSVVLKESMRHFFISRSKFCTSPKYIHVDHKGLCPVLEIHYRKAIHFIHQFSFLS